MDINQILGSGNKYLSKEDVTTTGTDAVIARVSIEEVGDDNKPVIHFMGGVKPCVCNKTNGAMLAQLFGNETDMWSGKTINVYKDPSVSYAGSIVGGVRFRGAVQQPVPAQAPPAALQAPLTAAEQYEREQRATAQSMAAMPNDDIPF